MLDWSDLRRLPQGLWNRYLAYAVVATSSEGTTSCRNCGHTADKQFCGSCGQEQQYAPLTLKAWIGDGFSRLDRSRSATPRTLWALLFRPGFLTLEWVEGRRARYHPPLRLYLWCAGAFFLTWALLARPSLLPGVLIEYLDVRNASAPSASDLARLGDIFPVLMALLIPAFAALTKLFFGSKRRFYSEHAVFALHFHAFFFLSAVLTLPLRVTGVIGLDGVGFYWAFIYCGYAIQNAFGTGSTWRPLAFILAYGVVAAAGVILAAEVLM